MQENYIKSLCKKEKDNTMVLKVKTISWAKVFQFCIEIFPR